MVDINRSPYFDDFDASKNHKQVLFVAGHPVQARELNNIQSAQHNQMKNFAGHIFKDGSRVSGGTVLAITREYVRLASEDSTGQSYTLSTLPKNAKVVGKSSGVEATILNTIEATSDDPATLGVQYTKIGNDAQQIRFVPGEELEIQDESGLVLKTLMVRCPTCPGYLDPQDKIKPCAYDMKLITVGEGTYYYDGYFISVKASEIVYSKYGDAATCKIGFDVVERIVTPSEDAQLFDNSLGYPNETAPGADRLVVELVLSKRTNDFKDGSRFIEIASIEEGFIQVLQQDYQYANIMDTMAKRTWEESGNYTVADWIPRYREHKAKYIGDPNGFKTDGDVDMLNAVISPGIGYVKGYRIETAFDKFINIPKARTTLQAYDGAAYFAQGAYVDLVPDETLSVWPNSPASQSIVDLTDIQLYDQDPLSHAPAGTIVGRMKVGDATYIGENKHGQKVWRYKVIEYSIQQGKIVKAASSETNRFLAVPEQDQKFAVHNVGNIQSSLVFKLPKNNIKSLRNIDRPDRSSMSITLRRKLTATLGSSGEYTFTLSQQNFDSAIKDTIIIVGNAGAYTSVYATSDNCKPAGNTLVLNLGSEHSGKKVTIIHSVHTVGLIEKQKQSMSTFKNAVNKSDLASWVSLGKADVYKIESVMAYASGSSDQKTNVTDLFELDTGVTPSAYNESRIKLREGQALSNSVDKVDIKFRYFNHSDTNQAGYFTIDSYRAVMADDESGVDYTNLPTYWFGTSRASVADVLDFRPINLSGQATGEMPATGGTALFNMEYYVGRRDLLAVDKDGNFSHIFGTPSDDPKAPMNRNPDIMPLYEVHIPAYTYSYRDVGVKRIENKRYTMRDIGRLETRIDNLEYYTTLSLLESTAAADDVKDSNGLSRFKNGFVVDDFKKYGTGDTASNEFRAVIDRNRGELRPYYYMFSRTGVFNETKSENAVLKNGVIIKPYTHEKIDEQPFATRSLSINPYIVVRASGNLILSPNIDNWSDTSRIPEMNIDIDTGVDAVRKIAERQNSIVTAFNAWSHANRNILVSAGEGIGVKTSTDVQTSTRITETQRNQVSTQSRFLSSAEHAEAIRRGLISGRRSAREVTTTNTTITTRSEETLETTTTTRTQTNASIESRTESYTFDRVTNVELQPYMRATTIEFTASGLYPNTRHYVFFDNQNVTAMTTLLGSTDKIKDALIGNLLISDSKGILHGSINIQEGQFFTGVKEVRITNDPHNTKDAQNEISFAAGQFFAGGIKQEKQNLNLNVTTPVYTETESIISQETSQPRVTGTRVVGQTSSSVVSSRLEEYDPLAQSFKFDDNDFMISKIGLWFETVHEGTEVEVQIRDMVNGYPGKEVLGKTVMKAENIKTSWNASEKTEFEFATPVRIQKGVEYCFVIMGASPMTRVWLAKMGETCVNVPNKVADAQVTLGSSFRSQNNSTWTAEQFEDIMYEIYAAKFTDGQMKVAVDIHGGLEEVYLDAAPFEAEAGTNLVRVYMQDDHGLVVGDKVHINCYPDQQYDVNLTNGYIHVGHYMEIDNQRSSAKVKAVKYRDSTHATVTVEKLNGCITPSSSFLATAFIAKPGKQDAFGAYFDIKPEDYDVRQAAGVFVNVETPLELNGIPLQELNNTHQVKRIDDNKTFVIEVNTSALKTGRFGPNYAKVIVNRKADMLNISANYQLHNAREKWTFKAHSHGWAGTTTENSNYHAMGGYQFDMKADRYLDRPIKIASKTNEHERLTDAASLQVEGIMVSDSPYLSPVFAADTFSAALMSNDVFVLDKDAVNQDPNGSGRFLEETDKSFGSERFKYVTQSIFLKNPAADLKIWFDVYKPAHTDFDIYIKLMTAEITQIDDQEWVKIENIDKTLISADLNSFVEYDLLLSETNPTLAGADNLFSGFKIKLVGRTKNSVSPPLFRNLRMIAYT